MTEEQFWTYFKGMVAQYVLSIQSGVSPIFIMLTFASWLDSVSPYIMEKEGIEGKITPGTSLRWLLEYLIESGNVDQMPQEERISHINSIREILLEENDVSEELEQAMDAFAGTGDISLFKDVINEL